MEFKITVISISKALEKKVGGIHEHMGNFSKEKL